MSYTKKSWSETKAELRQCMAQWQVISWDIECETTRYSDWLSDEDKRRVVVWYVHPETGEEKRMETDRLERPMDNLRAIYLTLDDIRRAEKRGLGELMRQHFAALPAPKVRDPYELLGIRPDADRETIDAVYRSKAKRLHPDTGGYNEAMAELTAAYELVKSR